MIVAIDGPAGSGKSTVAKRIAQRLGLSYLDTGAMYRAVTFACLQNGIDLSDTDAVANCAQTINIRFEASRNDNSADDSAKPVTANATQRVFIDTTEVTADIRTVLIDQNVSQVAAIPEVRQAMVRLQQQAGEKGNVVAEGRDIGTTVFPNADVKIFLTADACARAHRRAVQRSGGDEAKATHTPTNPNEEQQILQDIKRRDEIDSTRAVSPLVAATDAHHIDSSNLSVDEVCAKIEAYVHQTAATKKATAFIDPLDKYYERPVAEFSLFLRALLKFVVAVCQIYTKIKYRWKIENFDTLLAATVPASETVTNNTSTTARSTAPASKKGVIIIMNHVSFLDPFLPTCSLILSGRSVRPIYKSEFNHIGILRWALPRFGCFPVSRNTADIKALRRAQRALQRGESILIYPEGTRVRTDDQPVEIHGGFALLAKMAKADIIPMAIVGARDITPPGKCYPRPKKVFCRVGTPIVYDEGNAKNRREYLAQLEQQATQQMYALRDALKQEHPGRN